MSEPVVLTEIRGTTAVITINRPDKLNALSREVFDTLNLELDEIESNTDLRAVIVTGAGKAFVAGADIAQLSKMSPLEAREESLQGQATFRRLETFHQPVIAAVNGFALGGGCELAMACHLRLASVKAKFGQPEVKLGLIPGYAGTQRLPRLVGKGMAMELLLTGKIIDAAEAHRIGLVNHVYEPEELMTAAQAMAEEMALQGPLAVRLAIEAVNGGIEGTLEEGAALEAHLFATVFSSEDMKEGTSAFLEKRAAEFTNR